MNRAITQKIKNNKNIIINLYKQGYSCNIIGNKIGASNVSICNYLKVWKIKRRKCGRKRIYTIEEARERQNIEHKKYNKKYRQQIQQWQNQYRKTNINYRILGNLRTKLHYALKNKVKSKSTIQLLGCNIKFLKRYLRKHFKKGMNWKNYGRGKNKWCIDHIIPCKRFNLSKAREQRKCFHYKNLQPLWFIENLKKSAGLRIKKLVSVY